MKTWMEVFSHLMDSDVILCEGEVMSSVFNVPETGQMIIGHRVFRPEENKEVNADNNWLNLVDMYGKVYGYTTYNANNFKRG